MIHSNHAIISFLKYWESTGVLYSKRDWFRKHTFSEICLAKLGALSSTISIGGILAASSRGDGKDSDQRDFLGSEGVLVVAAAVAVVAVPDVADVTVVTVVEAVEDEVEAEAETDIAAALEVAGIVKLEAEVVGVMF